MGSSSGAENEYGHSNGSSRLASKYVAVEVVAVDVALLAVDFLSPAPGEHIFLVAVDASLDET